MPPPDWPEQHATPRLAAARCFGGLSAISDRWLVCSAVATAAGAWWAHSASVSIDWWWGALLAAVGLFPRLRLALPVGLLLLATALMASQVSQLTAAKGGAFEGTATIVEDPDWRFGALRVAFSAEIEAQEFRWEGRARGPAAWTLENAAVGERWHLGGKADPADPEDRKFQWPRHLAGSAQISSAYQIDEGSAPFRFANSIRALVATSGESLSQRDAALLAGFVYGDERGQLPEVVHDFRATSLTHLLAVSGSNVAFVLLLFAPLLVRLRPWARLVAVAVVLTQFAIITRGEPSVLRACVLAVLAVGAHAVGRRASAPRLLALAVIVLLAVDPLLVRSVGFQLSVAATAAIVAFARPLSQVLWGPGWLRLALAATLVAQAGVLPVQVAVFGSLPLVSIPANVLAAPMAGPAMVWGLTAGVAGGLAGDAVAAVLHLPTKLMLGWVAGVARWGAELGWPRIEAAEIAWVSLAVGAGAALVWAVRRQPKALRLAAVAAAAAGLWVAAGVHRPALPSSTHLSAYRTGGTAGTAGTLHGSGPESANESVWVVVDRPDASRALGALANAGVGRIDVLVAKSASRDGREAVRALSQRHEIGTVYAPTALGGSVRYVSVEAPMTLGGLTVVPRDNRLDVEAPVQGAQ